MPICSYALRTNSELLGLLLPRDGPVSLWAGLSPTPEPLLPIRPIDLNA